MAENTIKSHVSSILAKIGAGPASRRWLSPTT
ncbi:hypothetical protein ACQ86D_32670 [Streptomyces galilaeus]